MYARKRCSKIGQSILAVGLSFTFYFSSGARSETILDLEPTNVNANRIDMAMVTSKKRQGE